MFSLLILDISTELSKPCCVQVMEKQLVVNVEDDPEPGSVEELGQDFISCQGKAHTSPIPLPGSMALPPFSNVVSRQAFNINFYGKLIGWHVRGK